MAHTQPTDFVLMPPPADPARLPKTRQAPQTEARMLVAHGTEPSRLSPRALIQTAEADLRRRDQQQDWDRVKALVDRGLWQGGGREAFLTAYGPRPRTTFLPKHVLGARSVADVLAYAAQDREAGLTASDPSRLRVYWHEDVLEGALALATEANDVTSPRRISKLIDSPEREAHIP